MVSANAPSASAASAATSVFTPIPPARLTDTRMPMGSSPLGTLPDGGTIVVQVGGIAGIPSNATAAVLNVTATNTTAPGFVTVWPAGQPQPLASSLNPERAGETIPNLVTVPLNSAGQVAVFSMTRADIIVDAFGYYTPATSATAGRFVAVGPDRAYDSRTVGPPLPAGATVHVPLGGRIGPNATAVVLNVTVDHATADGFWTVWATGSPQPPTSNLNLVQGGTVPNQVIVPVGTGGSVDIFTQSGGNVIVDVDGWFTGPSDPQSTDGLFVPITPTRFLDTRTVSNPLGDAVRLWPDWTVEMAVIGRSGIPYTVSALVMNTTIVNSRGPGFTTVYPAGQPRPLASSLNSTVRAQLIANHTVSPVGVRGVAFYSQTGSHFVVDVTGWYTGNPRPSALATPVNPQPAPPPPPDRLVVPRLGLDTSLVEAGSLADLVDDPGWLPGSGLPGEPGNGVIAGHRVSHTHPFRFIDAIQAGDEIDVYADGLYRYQVTGSVVVPAADINTIVAWTAQPTVTLYACHPPTSTDFRYVVKSAYIGDA
jgi:LPXTG-site transpeptidase (sortase) family protein